MQCGCWSSAGRALSATTSSGASLRQTHRGRPDPFGSGIERLLVDRNDAQAFAKELSDRTFDAAVDFAAYDGQDARHCVDTLQGQLGHYVFVSSGQVYLVRKGADRPGTRALPEAAYDGPLAPSPEDAEDLRNWEYGMGKRAAEDVLADAFSTTGFPATRLRIPMVNGARDTQQRIGNYLWRILDGGPILLPDGGSQVLRHIHTDSLAQDEMPTLKELVESLYGLVGASPRIVPVPSDLLRQHGLSPQVLSPFSDPWMS